VNFTDVDSLSFDCYGTLIDWETGILKFLDTIRVEYPALPAREILLETYGVKESEMERDFPTALYPEILARSLQATTDVYGIELPDDRANDFGESVPEWPAFPDSAEALARLAGHYKLIILSNIDRASFVASNRKLGVTFDAILTAEDIGSYKPDPANFEALLGHLDAEGIDRDRHLHVAQSLFHDHKPAKAIGLSTVWIDRRQGKAGAGATPEVELDAQPDATYPSMAAFADAVDAGVGR
jgi:2-haloacid dehalogenase